MAEIQLPSRKRAADAALPRNALPPTAMIRIGDHVKWAFGRRWQMLAIDGDEAWVKSPDRCSSCKRTAPLSQLQFISPILVA